MAGGALLLAESTAGASFSLFVLATVLSALGFGAANAAGLRLVVPLAGEERRGELFSSVYVVSYLAFGVPVVAAGALADGVGLAAATGVFSGAVGVAALIGGTAQWAASRQSGT